MSRNQSNPMLDRVLGRNFNEMFATIPSPPPVEKDPGVIDVTPDTIADREMVAKIREVTDTMGGAK